MTQSGMIKGKQLNIESVNLIPNESPLALTSFTVSTASSTFSGKQLINLDYLDDQLNLKIDISQINDTATSSTTSLWSANKIYNELQAIEANDLQINDNVIATDSVWSSDKIDSEIQGLSSSVNTRIDTVSSSVIGLSQSVDSLSASVDNNSVAITGLSQSIDSVSISVANILNDSITGSTTGWSSQKIDNELDLKLDDSQLNDLAATSSTTSLWSVNKIYNELQAIEANDLQINDNVIATDSVWSSDKIDSEIQGLSSSVNTRIDTVSSSVIGLSQSVDSLSASVNNNSIVITGLSQSIDGINVTISNIEGDIVGLSNSIDSVSISVANILNDSITGSTTGWTSQKIANELELKLDDSQLNDNAATSSTTSLWSVNKIYNELQAIEANDLQINDLIIATNSLWSSDKIDNEIQGLSSSVNTRIDTVSASVIDNTNAITGLSQSVDSLSASVDTNATTINGLSQSIDVINVTISNIEGDIIGLSNSIDTVSISVANLLNDSITGSTTGWTSQKISNELELKLDDSQLNDGAATSSTTSLWSVNKIYNELQAIEANDLQINDNVTATNSLWSSDKIDSEIQGLSSSVNTRIDTVSASVIGLSQSVDSLSASVDNNSIVITGLSQSIDIINVTISNIENDIDSVSISVANLLNDSITGSTTGWTSEKINSELDLKLDDSQLNDAAATSSTTSLWSVNKIYTELQLIESNDLQINDSVTATDSVWSSDKINSEIQGLSSSVNTRIDTVSASVIGLSQSVDSLSASVDNNSITITGLSQSIDIINVTISNIENDIDSVSISVANLLNDSITGSTTGWSSQKIDSELDLKLDDSQLNDAAATSSTTSLWSVNKIYNELQAIEANDLQINDAVTATDSVWSSDKIDSELDLKVDKTQIDDGGTGTTSLWSVDRIITELDLKLDDTQLNDSITTTDNLWSGEKIDTEIQGLSSSVNNRIDTVSASVIGLSQSVDIINGTISNIENDIDSVSISVANLLNDSITGSTTGWSSEKIDEELITLEDSVNNKIDSVSISVANILNDSITGSTTGWSSQKIDSELDLKLDDSQLNDLAATSSTTSLWSVNKIYNELQAIEANDLQINDAVTATDSVWSSDKINSEIQGLSSSVNTRIDTVSSSVIGLSQSVDSLSASVDNNSITITGLSQSIDIINVTISNIENDIDSVSISVANILNDSITGSTTGWTSEKINNELDLKLDDSQLNDAAATSSTTSLWSVNKIYTELQAIDANDLQINDNITATDSVWSSDKIDSEIQGLSSSVNTRIDTVSASVIDNTNTITGLSQSVDSLSQSVSINTTNIDSVSISVSNLLNDSITGSTTGWTSQKINNELDLKLDDSQLNDAAATSSTTSLWSANKIYTELQAIDANDLQINDSVTATDSVWSSDKIDSELDLKVDKTQIDDGGTGTTSLWSVDRLTTEFELKLDDSQLNDSITTADNVWSAEKIDTEIQGLSSSVNSRIDTVSFSVIGLSQSVDSLSQSVSNNTVNITGLSQSIDSVSISVANLLNDSITGSTTGWSSDKINTEITNSSFYSSDGTLTSDRTVSMDNNGLNFDNVGSSILRLFNDGRVRISDAFELPTTDGTAGYVLQTDGNGTVSWALDNRGLTGSGAVNQVAFFDGTSSLTGSNDLTYTGQTFSMKFDGSPSFEILSDATAGHDTELTLRGSRTANPEMKLAKINFDNFAFNATDKRGAVIGIHNANSNISADNDQVDFAIDLSDGIGATPTLTERFRFTESGEFRIFDNDQSHYLSISAGSLTQSLNYTFPNTYGIDGQVLSNDGSGTLSWIDVVTNSITINDGSTSSTTSVWSANKIYTELENKLDTGLTESYIFIGNTANEASKVPTSKLYIDNVSDILTETYVSNNYFTASIGQKVEGDDQIAEKTQTDWMISKKDPNQDIVKDLDISSASLFATASNQLNISQFIGIDTINIIDSSTSSFSATISSIFGLSDRTSVKFKVTTGGVVTFEHVDTASASIYDISLLSGENATITGSTYSEFLRLQRINNINIEEDNVSFGAGSVTINDTSTNSTTEVWSANKIYTELQTIEANDLQINDNVTATDSVWSSDKIETEIDNSSLYTSNGTLSTNRTIFANESSLTLDSGTLQIDSGLDTIDYGIRMNNADGFEVAKLVNDALNNTGELQLFNSNTNSFFSASNGIVGINGEFRLLDDDQSHYLRFSAGSLTQSLTYVFPSDYGTDGQALVTDGSGTLSWTDIASTLEATNGLTITGNTVSLGGALSQAETIIEGSTGNLSIGTTASPLGNLNIYSDFETNILSTSMRFSADSAVEIGDYGSSAPYGVPELRLAGLNNNDNFSSHGKISFNDNNNYIASGRNSVTLDPEFYLSSSNDIVFYVTSSSLLTNQSNLTETLRINETGIRFYDSYTLPTIDGTAGYVLTTDGSGTVSWGTVSTASLNINDSSTNSTTEVWSVDKIYTEIQGLSQSIEIETLNTYTELDSYSGSATTVVLNNECYGGIWERDDAIVIGASAYGVERNGFGGSKWKRIFEISDYNVNWFNESGLLDGSTDTSTYIQDAINHANTQTINTINFGGVYLASNLDFSTPGRAGVVFKGNGAEMNMNYSSNDEYLIFFGNGGGSGGTEFTDFNLIGTQDSDSTYTADKHKLIKVSNSSYLNIHDCSFYKFTSQAIDVDGLAGSLTYKGMSIDNCVFNGQIYDSSTTEQASIYLREDTEYSSISNNNFNGVVSAVKGVNAANLTISGNMCQAFVGPSASAGLDLTRGVYHFSTTVGSGNNNKIIFNNNITNHNSVGQVLLYFEGTNTVNLDNTVEIFANNFLANTNFPAIYLKDFDNPIIGGGNHIRSGQAVETTGCITLDNVDNAVVFGNNGSGRYMVNLLNGSENLRYDFHTNNFTSGLSTNGQVDVGTGSLWTNTFETTSTSTLNIDAEIYDNINVTDLAVDMTIAEPTNPRKGVPLTIRIKDNGTSRGLIFNSIFRTVGPLIPQATKTNITLYIICVYNETDDKWDIIEVTESLDVDENYGASFDGSGSLVADDLISDPDESTQAGSVQLSTNGNSAFFPIQHDGIVRIQTFEFYSNARGYTRVVDSGLTEKQMLNDVNSGGSNVTSQEDSDTYNVKVVTGDYIQFYHEGGSYRAIERLIITYDSPLINDAITTTYSTWSSDKINSEITGASFSTVTINDTITATDSVWSSTKIDTELDLKLDDSQLNDAAATSSTTSLWSVNKIYTELQAIEANDLQINDGSTSSTTSVWSGNKVYTEIQGLSSSVFAEIDSVSISVSNILNDSITGSTTGWSSQKINNELDLKLDDSQLNDAAATSSTTSLWSVNKIYNEIQNAAVNLEADNGLTLSGGTISLGGSLNQTTTIDGGGVGYGLSLGSTTSPIGDVDIISNDNTTIDSSGIILLPDTAVQVGGFTTSGNELSMAGLDDENPYLRHPRITFNSNKSVIGRGQNQNTSENEFYLLSLEDIVFYTTASSLLGNQGTFTETLRITDLGVRFYDAYTLPTIDGTAGYVLTTDGSGTVSWTASAGGGGSVSLSENNILIGNSAGEGAESPLEKIYIDNLSNEFLSNEYLFTNYFTAGLAQKIESKYQVAERTQQDWMISKKHHNQDIIFDIDISDTNIYSTSSQALDIENYLGADVLNIIDSSTTSAIGITISSITGVLNDYRFAIRLDGEGTITFDDVTAASASVNDIVLIGTQSQTITGSTYSADVKFRRVNGVNVQIDPQVSVVSTTSGGGGGGSSINDSITATDSTWSSDKIDSELDLKLDDSQLNDGVTGTNSFWSSTKIASEISSGNTNIYTTDGSLGGDRTITGGGNDITLANGDFNILASGGGLDYGFTVKNPATDILGKFVYDGVIGEASLDLKNSSQVSYFSAANGIVSVAAAAEFRIFDNDNSHYLRISAGSLTANRTYVFPSTYGSNGDILQGDGAGNLSWNTFIDDGATNTSSVWSSDKVDTELDLKLDDTQLNDATTSTTSFWSSTKIASEITAGNTNTNIYNSNGTLGANRTIEGATFDIILNDGDHIVRAGEEGTNGFYIQNSESSAFGHLRYNFGSESGQLQVADGGGVFFEALASVVDVKAAFRIYDDNESHYAQISAGSLTQSLTYTLPPDYGSDEDILEGNGSGSLTWKSRKDRLKMVRWAGADKSNINLVNTGIFWSATASSSIDVNNTFVTNPNSATLRFSEEGIYKIEASVYCESATARTSVGIRLDIDGTLTGSKGAGGYIRVDSGHDQATVQLEEIIALTVSTTKDVIVRTTIEGAAGTVNQVGEFSKIIITKLADTV